MRFRLRKQKANKHAGERVATDETLNHEAVTSSRIDNEPTKHTNKIVIEGLNSMEGSSVVSSNKHPGSVSENLVILLSIHSVSGLTISEREPFQEAFSSTKSNKVKKKEQPKHKRKLRETLDRCPTTVVVSSVERELTKEGYPMETYVPSLALSEKNFWNSQRSGTRIFTAYWPNAETVDDRSVLNKSPPSTIQLNRTMKRVVYQRDLAAQRASHFRHKRIDLNVSLSRGTEILRLGVASIAISGNEEEEQLINAPIRPRMKDTSSRARCWTLWTVQPKNDDNFFSDDTTHMFSIADNATLCLGVRVISHDIIQHEELIDQQDRIFSMESEREKSVIRLTDDNDLLSGTSFVKSESRLSLNSAVGDVAFFGCCTTDGLSLSMLVDQFREDTSESNQFYSNKTTEATVTPIYLLSDMSESTANTTETGTEEETEEGTAVSTCFVGQKTAQKP